MSVDFRRAPPPSAPPPPDLLRSVSEDLGRLDGMLSDAIGRLTGTFNQIQQLATDSNSPEIVLATFDAIGALQFQDMASQLIVHTKKVLQGCAFKLASETMGHEVDEEAAPFGDIASDRPNPVTQSEMDAGSIELF